MGIRGETAITTWPLNQCREISTDFTQSIESMRVAMARGSTRANFSPGAMFTNAITAFSLSGVGAPETVTFETENIDDHAKR